LATELSLVQIPDTTKIFDLDRPCWASSFIF